MPVTLLRSINFDSDNWVSWTSPVRILFGDSVCPTFPDDRRPSPRLTRTPSPCRRGTECATFIATWEKKRRWGSWRMLDSHPPKYDQYVSPEISWCCTHNGLPAPVSNTATDVRPTGPSSVYAPLFAHQSTPLVWTPGGDRFPSKDYSTNSRTETFVVLYSGVGSRR